MLQGKPRLWLIEAVIVFGLFSVGLAIRGSDLSALAAYPDELTYAHRAIDIVTANWSWLPGDMWDQPPLFTYILALVVAARGATMESLRLVSVVFGSLTIVVAYLLGKSMYGKMAGGIAAVAVTFDGYHILYSRLIYIEALACLLILTSTWLFWEGVVKRKNYNLSILGGFVFGLALDTKYIAMVMGVALLFFMIVYWNKFGQKFPVKQTLVFFSASILVFLPVLIDLAANNVNPFYFDLIHRFQLHQVNTLAVSVRSGQLFVTGFTRFVQVFFHVSSTNPFQVFPLLEFDIPVWTALVSIVLIFFAVSFLFRRSLPDGLLLVLFVALLAFAFSYPGKRAYFSLYPSLVFMIMLGRVGQLSIEMINNRKVKQMVIPIVSVAIICLLFMGLAINASAVPAVYNNGFGDWDEIYPIVNYIGQNHGNNSYVAMDLAEFGYYIELNHINVSLAWMKQPVEYYSEPPINQTLMTPSQGQYPIYYVLSTTAIEKIQPQFIIMSRIDYQSTTTAFHQFIAERYYQPLNTKLVLFFQIRPGGQSISNYTSSCC